jgi:hypothetical protein
VIAPEASYRPPTVLVNNINELFFDIWDLDRQFGKIRTLEIVSTNIFHYWELFEDLEIDYDTFSRFAVKVGEGYQNENPYHHATHAADVT